MCCRWPMCVLAVDEVDGPCRHRVLDGAEAQRPAGVGRGVGVEQGRRVAVVGHRGDRGHCSLVVEGVELACRRRQLECAGTVDRQQQVCVIRREPGNGRVPSW